MKLNRFLVILFFATAAIPMGHAQTTKTRPLTKKSVPPPREGGARRLPFADARNMTVIVLWVPPSDLPTVSGGIPSPIGSGVWIGRDGYVATCQHVIAGHTGSFKIGLAIDTYISEHVVVASSATVVDADLVASDSDTDVAILKAHTSPEKLRQGPPVIFLGPGTPSAPVTPEKPLIPKGANLKTNLPELGETLLLAGFPLGANTLVLQTGVATGFFSRPRKQASPPITGLRIMLSLVSNPGNSGGPVLDADGKLIGLLEGALQSPMRDEQNHVLYYMRAKLDPNGQPMHDASGQPILEPAEYLQNAGISFAVPARFIAEIAKTKKISLD